MGFARRAANQKAFDANVFIEIGPVETLTTSDQPPIGSLDLSPVRQTRIPRDWHGHGSTIDKMHRQSILGDLHIFGLCRSKVSL